MTNFRELGCVAAIYGIARNVSNSMFTFRTNAIQSTWDWAIADVERLCHEHNVMCEPPRGGDSHYNVAHHSIVEKLTIPYKRPIKVVYIRALVAFIDKVREQRGASGLSDRD